MDRTRRHVLAVTSTAAAVTFARTAVGGWEPSERYPDPAIKSLDPSFNRYRLYNASIERLATGMRWCEGPAWLGDARCLIWSDIPNNALMRWDDETGAVSVTAGRQTTPTATPATVRAASSPASTKRAASREPNTTGRSRS